MPKNKGRGGKNYRRGKNENETKRELVFKEEGMEYAQVIKMLGNGRLEVHCFDGKRRIGHICGRLKKKVWISMDDIVLVGLRDFQDEKCDILLKYLADEVRNLKQYNEIPDSIRVNENGGQDIVFEDSDGDEDGDDDDEEPVSRPKGKQVESSDDEEKDEEEKEEEEEEEETTNNFTYQEAKHQKKDEIDIDDI